MSRARKAWRLFGVAAFNVIVAVLLTELTLFALVRLPGVTRHTPAVVRGFVQKVYRHFQRNFIQYDAACAQYDPGLGYTLRPGTCVFSNVEFSNEYRINSRGLRDTEDALDRPDVIFLGDSQAMGWGVAQHEAMPQALARKTGLKVLNASISSYGTARERMLLDRLDTSRLRAIVIQYCDNDSPENQAFQSAGNTLTIMGEDQYRWATEFTSRARRYYPGKYVFRLGLKALQLEEPEVDRARLDPNLTPADEARLFIHTLVEAGRTNLEGVAVIVFEVNSNPARPRSFIAALQTVKEDATYPAYVRDMTLIETEGRLGPDDFFVIDDHLTTRGNDVIADMVARALSERGVTPGPPR